MEQKRLNVLFLGTLSSVHDQKWMFYVAEHTSHSLWAIGETQNDNKISEDVREAYHQRGITLLPSIPSFSLRHPLQTAAAIRSLRKIISSLHIDLVHIYFATPHALWSNFIACPYIITTRGSDVLLVLPALQKSAIAKLQWYQRLLWRLFKQAFLKAATITCTSQKQIQQLTSVFGWKVSPMLIRTGVPVEKISATTGNEKLHPSLQHQPFVFSPRYIQPVYNTLLQAEAIALLEPRWLREYTFVFIKGPSYNPQYLAELTRQLDQIPEVRYLVLDFLSQEDMWQYYKNASLTIMTPQSDGTPNSALEAMAAGCPLIVPDLDYDKVLFEDTCWKYRHTGPEELAALLRAALSDYPTELLDRAKAQVIRYGNQTVEMQKIMTLYTSFEKPSLPGN